MFTKKVNLRNRQEMIDFLLNHFRYDTMNSWNNATSYAHNMKIYRLGLTREQEDKAYELLDSENMFQWHVNHLVSLFENETGYTAMFNGRSGGYLVMYDLELRDSGYESECVECGQLNYRKITESSHTCGVCGGERKNLEERIMQKIYHPGRGIDHREDFSDWSINEIRERVRLVQRFDKLCEDIRQALIEYLDSHECVEKEIQVTKKVKSFQKV